MYPHHLHNCRNIPDSVGCRLCTGKQIVEIILLKEELVHDINADSHHIETSRKAADTPVATDDKRLYEMNRKIDNAVNHIVRAMAAYLLVPSPVVHRISSNHAHGWEEKSIYLALPNNWPPYLLDSLRDQVHEHVVKSAEAELLVPILSPSDDYVQYCKLAAVEAEREVNSIINDRLGIPELDQTPFG